MSLLCPDDSLASHEDLAAMALFSSQPAAPCNVTTLVLPPESATQLDPSQLPTSESDDPNTIYHVTTTATSMDSQVTVVCYSTLPVADPVALLAGQWTCDALVVGSSPRGAPLCSGLGQATYTCVPLSTSSIIWYRTRG